jgi:hypothetical protein
MSDFPSVLQKLASMYQLHQTNAGGIVQLLKLQITTLMSHALNQSIWGECPRTDVLASSADDSYAHQGLVGGHCIRSMLLPVTVPNYFKPMFIECLQVSATMPHAKVQLSEVLPEC